MFWARVCVKVRHEQLIHIQTNTQQFACEQNNWRIYLRLSSLCVCVCRFFDALYVFPRIDGDAVVAVLSGVCGCPRNESHRRRWHAAAAAASLLRATNLFILYRFGSGHADDYTCVFMFAYIDSARPSLHGRTFTHSPHSVHSAHRLPELTHN